MRKKDILGNFTQNPDMVFSHSIKKVSGKTEVYSAFITFLPGCKDKFVEASGHQIQWAGLNFKILMYLPVDENWCLSAYYSPDDTLLFWYFDISRKNFVDEHGMPCTDDIYLDLVISPDGQILTLDADELQDALDKNEISIDDYDHAYRVHDQIIDSKWNNVEYLNQLCDKLFLDFVIGNIPEYDTFAKIEPLNKGWSNDKKHYIETADNKRLLLRVSDIEEIERKKGEYSMLKRAATLGIPLTAPVNFGLCNDKKSVYQLLTWVDGVDMDTVLPNLSETEQYALGIKAGELLRKIHTLPAPENVEPWDIWFYRKVQGRIDFYNANPIKSTNGDLAVRYLQDNRHLLVGRPQTFNHGDFNKTNLIVMPNGQIGAIDFNYYNKDHGDPWWEFDPVNWGSNVNAHYCTGLIKGYFGGEPPSEFFEMFSYYLAYDALAALCDTSEDNQGEPEEGIRHMENVLAWFDGFKSSVPNWYLKNIHVQWADGIPYKLEKPFDFSFLEKYGRVFKAFDEQGSGNIAFGTEKDGKRYFVKFAGAPKTNYIANRDSGEVDTERAIKMLKAAIPIYTELVHPTLIKLISAEEIGNGYAAVFEYEYAMGIEPKGSPDYMRFMQMPFEHKMRAFEDIVKFHIHVASKGYVALDFYDGSILYDYKNEKVIICDIDLYQKSPFINVGNMGIIGSARYVSPEECAEDEVIDEITNVYTMGATAFALFAFGDRTPEKWPLNTNLYEVAKKAVSDARNERQQSITQFLTEWRAAK